jgi:hypothetical protein
MKKKIYKWFLKVFASKSILKYTDYKKEQSLWLQRENLKRTDRGTNTEQFCIECYCSYLKLIGYENKNADLKVVKYLNNIGTYHITTGMECFNHGYDKEIADNINYHMDRLLI